MQLPSNIVDAMGAGWFGFGAWKGPYWFIGPEPGQAKREGDNSVERANAWEELGATELVDCIAYHRLLKIFQYHRRQNTATQPTWRRLILLLLSYLNEPTDLEMQKQYQRAKWGVLQGDTCVIDMSPFAANSRGVPRDRQTHKAARVRLITERLEIYRPNFVVLYGDGPQHDLQPIIGHALASGEVFVRNGTAFIYSWAPTWPSSLNTDLHWYNLGKALQTVRPFDTLSLKRDT